MSTGSLDAYRDHCERMATARHKDGCVWTHDVSGWRIFCGDHTSHGAHDWTEEIDWGNGAKIGVDRLCPGYCGGCVTDTDRASWAALAQEANRHLNGET